MNSKLLAITANTFSETVRQPIFSVLIWVAAAVIVLNTALVGFTLESDGDLKMAKDIGLATLLLYGLLAAVFSATTVISREIESHTVLTVVSKPVSRTVFLLGKYVGVTGAVAVGYFFLSLVLLLTIRHGTMPTAADEYDKPVLIFGGLALLISLVAAVFGNYVYGWHFPAALLGWVVPALTLATLIVLCISPKWAPQSPFKDFGDMQMPAAIFMAFCGVLVLTAFAVALSTRFSQVLTLILCAGVYVLGLLSDYYLGRPAEAHEGWLFSALYAVVPNFQFFWTGDALTQERIIPFAQCMQVAGYAALYSLAILSLAVALFQTREVS